MKVPAPVTFHPSDIVALSAGAVPNVTRDFENNGQVVFADGPWYSVFWDTGLASREHYRDLILVQRAKRPSGAAKAKYDPADDLSNFGDG